MYQITHAHADYIIVRGVEIMLGDVDFRSIHTLDMIQNAKFKNLSLIDHI